MCGQNNRHGLVGAKEINCRLNGRGVCPLPWIPALLQGNFSSEPDRLSWLGISRVLATPTLQNKEEIGGRCGDERRF